MIHQATVVNNDYADDTMRLSVVVPTLYGDSVIPAWPVLNTYMYREYPVRYVVPSVGSKVWVAQLPDGGVVWFGQHGTLAESATSITGDPSEYTDELDLETVIVAAEAVAEAAAEAAILAHEAADDPHPDYIDEDELTAATAGISTGNAMIASGTYVGNGSTKDVSLGFSPLLVFIANETDSVADGTGDGSASFAVSPLGGGVVDMVWLRTGGVSDMKSRRDITIGASKFTVVQNVNLSGKTYRYVAFGLAS